jgi:hypothetical protein
LDILVVATRAGEIRAGGCADGEEQSECDEAHAGTAIHVETPGLSFPKVSAQQG